MIVDGVILVIPRVTVWTVFTLCIWYSSSNSFFFDVRRCIHNTLILINATAKSWSFAWLDCFNITPVWYSSSYSCLFNTTSCIHNTLFLRNSTAKSWYFALLDCFNITPWTLCISYPKNFWSYPASYNTKDFGWW